jgi:hypothetical protein
MDPWISAADTNSWKLMPYPKPFEESPTGRMFASSRTIGAGEESMAYIHVDLHYPIAARNTPMVKMCLDQGVDVNAKLLDGKTPLTKAVVTAYELEISYPIGGVLLERHNTRRIVQLLLDHGAEKTPAARDLTKNLSNRRHQPDWFIEQLLAPSPHPKLCQFISMTDFVWAGEQDRLEDMLVQEPELLSVSEFHGVSPLAAAVSRNDERMVNMLLDKGASPDAFDPMGISPLAIAVARNLEGIARLLMEYGASITLEDGFSRFTPLEYTAEQGNHSMCSTLLENEKVGRPFEKRKILSKSLGLATNSCHTAVVRLLVKHGADVFMDISPFTNRKLPDNEGTFTPRRYSELMMKIYKDHEPVFSSQSNLSAFLLRYEEQTHKKQN